MNRDPLSPEDLRGLRKNRIVTCQGGRENHKYTDGSVPFPGNICSINVM